MCYASCQCIGSISSSKLKVETTTRTISAAKAEFKSATYTGRSSRSFRFTRSNIALSPLLWLSLFVQTTSTTNSRKTKLLPVHGAGNWTKIKQVRSRPTTVRQIRSFLRFQNKVEEKRETDKNTYLAPKVRSFLCGLATFTNNNFRAVVYFKRATGVFGAAAAAGDEHF